MLTKEQKAAAEQKVEWYKTKGQGTMSDMMIREVEEQYIHMARGGDGTINHMGEIRKEYYKGIPDEFFQFVCDRMEWRY